MNEKYNTTNSPVTTTGSMPTEVYSRSHFPGQVGDLMEGIFSELNSLTMSLSTHETAIAGICQEQTVSNGDCTEENSPTALIANLRKILARVRNVRSNLDDLTSRIQL